jgi:Protein of unknown function (DUF2924)
MTATSPVLKQIAGLPKLSYAELKALWREYFGVEPPAYRRGFLVRGLAHRLQELTLRRVEAHLPGAARRDDRGDREAERHRPARTTTAPGCPPVKPPFNLEPLSVRGPPRSNRAHAPSRRAART